MIWIITRKFSSKIRTGVEKKSFEPIHFELEIELILYPRTWDSTTDDIIIMENMAIRVVEFSNGGKKLERFLPKKSTYSKEIIEFWELG